MKHPIDRLVFLLSLLVALPTAAQPVELAGAQGAARLRGFAQQVVGGAAPTTHRVLTWARPPVAGSRYALNGRVQYQGVAGRGYLEMWSHFGAEGSFFSRTKADSGLLAALQGDSPGRYFSLPFDTGDSGLLPERVEINVVLPGAGSVTLSELRWSGGESAGTAAGAWWSSRDAGTLGAAVGVTLGLLGALSGVLGGRGRARTVVMAVFALFAALAAAGLGAGLYGALAAQPAHVVNPLLGIGALAGVLGGCGWWNARRRYADLEFRKMRAIDLDAGRVSPPS